MMPPNSLFSTQQVMGASIRGLGEAQTELERLRLAVSPDDGLQRQLLVALGQLQRYALGIVHVDTGRLKNSIFTDLEMGGGQLVGYVATNVDYAPAEEARGGSHAFFARTVREEGPRAVENTIFQPIVQG